MKIKHKYDTRTKQLSSKIKNNNAKYISKLKPKVDQYNFDCKTQLNSNVGLKQKTKINNNAKHI